MSDRLAARCCHRDAADDARRPLASRCEGRHRCDTVGARSPWRPQMQGVLITGGYWNSSTIFPSSGKRARRQRPATAPRCLPAGMSRGASSVGTSVGARITVDVMKELLRKGRESLRSFIREEIALVMETLRTELAEQKSRAVETSPRPPGTYSGFSWKEPGQRGPSLLYSPFTGT